MKNKLFETVMVCLAGSQVVASAAETPVPPRPNIIVILADDLGYGDVQCYNPARGKIPTSNIDHLAAQGMRFTDGHSSSAVCSPSRYTLLTGRYHWRTHLQTSVVEPWGKPLIAPERATIATLAKQHGYQTGAFGKWHLGLDWQIPPEHAELFQYGNKAGALKLAAFGPDKQRALWERIFSQPVANGPTTRGFDHYFGVDAPNYPPLCFIEDDRTVGIPATSNANRPALEGWTFEPILPTITERATTFIAKSTASGQPFFVYLPLTAPHAPLAVNAEWKGKSGLGLYADYVMETDAMVGRVMKVIADSGAAENTLVIFTSDNGCAPNVVQNLEKQSHFPSGPLRGYKTSVWEGGHRMPFIVRWPKVVKPGSVCGQLVHQADLMATFADILGTRLPDNVGEDSVSLLPLLEGCDGPVRQSAVSCSVDGVPGVRLGHWKYIPRFDGKVPAGRARPQVQLYDLSMDLGETHNLAAEHPQRIAEMESLLQKLIRDGRSTPGAPQKNDAAVIFDKGERHE
jgi:arylsulfatase A-like enzyme